MSSPGSGAGLPIDCYRGMVDSMMSCRGMSGVPTKMTLSADNSKLFFLDTNYNQSLNYIDISQASDPQSPLDWKTLCSPSELETGRPMSMAEILLRERQRNVSKGITTFTYNPKFNEFLIPAGGSLYLLKMTDSQGTDNGKGFTVKEIPSSSSSARMDAKRSPDAKFVSFIRDNDIWVADESGRELRLTFAANKKNVTAGVAEFIMQEEFKRFTGYEWSPKVAEGEPYRIAYLEVDENEVEVYSIPQAATVDGKVDEFRYPLAGGKNAKSTLRLVEFHFESEKVTDSALSGSIHERFPFCEYIPRFGWNADGSRVWVQVLDRAQQHLVFASLPLDAFRTPSVPHCVIREEKSNIWINITDIVHWLEDGSERVIWASEATFFRHLYLLTPNAANPNSTYDARQLTEGDWQVDAEEIFVDETQQVVYFSGTKDSPLEQHLYVTSYSSKSSSVHRLTDPGYSHSAIVRNGILCSAFSNLKEQPRTRLFRIVFPPPFHADNAFHPPRVELVATLKSHVRLSNPIFARQTPEQWSFTNSAGHLLHGLMYKPPGFDPHHRYPLVVALYGGPEVQLVTNEFRVTANGLKHQMFAALGHVVITVDNRGSSRRGLKFEGEIRERMGTVEVQDQVDAVMYCVKKGFVDPARVAVTGWSYGGYLSLMCIGQHPEVFKLAICGAPVTMWEAYDTGYTERYMNTPKANPSGYKRGSVIELATNFPNEPHRVLLIHGMIDENVHFCNTAMLISALNANNKPYDLALYPDERHGIRSFKNSQHYEMLSLMFLINHLGASSTNNKSQH